MIIFTILITLLTFFANIVGTISGFGVSTFMTPILILFLPFPETILLVCIIHWFHDVWKTGFFWHGIDWKLFFYFGVPTIGATFLGALLVSKEQSALLSSLLGLFLIVSVGMMYLMPYLTIPYNWMSTAIGGLLSGFFAGIFGIRGAVRSVFLVAFDLHKATFIGTTGAISFLLDSTRFVTYFFINGLRMERLPWWTFMFLVIASFLGAYVGYLVVDKIPQKQFRLIVAIFLLVVGIKLLVTPWLF
jgi:hypothetical protein